MHKQLSVRLDKLKMIFSLPRLYLSDFFIDLRSEIDLAFVKKRISLNKHYTNELNKELEANWSDFINKVNQFETEIFKKRKDNKLPEELTSLINAKIKLIESKLEKLTETDEPLFDEISFLIYDTKLLIKKNIFNNQCISLLNRDKCQMQRILVDLNYKTTIGKLIIVRNEYFGRQTLLMLNK